MFLWIASAIFGILLFHCLVFHRYNWPRTVWLINKIPGPRGLPYFGSTIRYWLLKNEDRLDDIMQNFREYGSTYSVWFSGVPCVFISEVEDYQNILGSREQSQKGVMYKLTIPWLGNGLLTNSGTPYQKRRKTVMSTFYYSILQDFVEVFNRNSRTLIEKVNMDCEKGPVQLSNDIVLWALDNICETAMGVKINAQSSEPSSYVNAVIRMGKIICQRLFSPMLFQDCAFALSPLGWEHRRIIKQLHKFTNKVIQEKKKAMEQLDHHRRMCNVEKKKASFLQLLLEKQEEEGLTDEEIRSEVDTIMFAGHDTTSLCLTWALFELGLHPDAQKKCFDEVKNIFGTSDRMPTYQDCMSMDYMKRVLLETLRLYPTIPVIARVFPKDVQLKNFLVPAGSEIVMCVYKLHRDPIEYPDPNRFDPDRFVQKELSKRSDYCHIPFSAGSRSCIGQKFAILEMLVLLTNLIRRYEFQTLTRRSDVKLVPDLTLHSTIPLSWKITKR